MSIPRGQRLDKVNSVSIGRVIKKKGSKDLDWRYSKIYQAKSVHDPNFKLAQVSINQREAMLTEALEKKEKTEIPDAIFLQTDPWKHRSKGMSCATCMWCVMKASVTGGKSKLGRCRRHAPTMGGYPVVFENDFCGDHKLDENKVG